MKEDTQHIKATPLASHCLHQEATEILRGTFLLVFNYFMINEFILLTPRFIDIDSDQTETGLLTEATLILRRPSSFAVPSLLPISCLIYSVRSREKKTKYR